MTEMSDALTALVGVMISLCLLTLSSSCLSSSSVAATAAAASTTSTMGRRSREARAPAHDHVAGGRSDDGSAAEANAALASALSKALAQEA